MDSGAKEMGLAREGAVFKLAWAPIDNLIWGCAERFKVNQFINNRSHFNKLLLSGQI